MTLTSLKQKGVDIRGGGLNDTYPEMFLNHQVFLLVVLITAVSWPQSGLCSFQDGPCQVPFIKQKENVSLSRIWQVLGPFRSGTRG